MIHRESNRVSEVKAVTSTAYIVKRMEVYEDQARLLHYIFHWKHFRGSEDERSEREALVIIETKEIKWHYSFSYVGLPEKNVFWMVRAANYNITVHIDSSSLV